MEKRWLQIFVIVLWIISVNMKHHKHHKRYEQGECGRPVGVNSFGNIVGGYDVGYYKYPWFVAMMRKNTDFCGGTLIASRFIVTAAHCYQPFFSASQHGLQPLEAALVPTLGVYNICRHETSQQRFKVEKVIVHELYRAKDPYYDITLVKLVKEARDFIPACLPRKAIDNKPKEGFVYGLGDLKYKDTGTTCTVHEARILIYGDNICRDMLSRLEEDPTKLENAFCAGYLEGGIDACQGDSGGPLTVIGSEGRHYVLGVTSFGYECAVPDTLGVYTDVSKYLDWLHEKMLTSTISTTKTTSTTAAVTIEGTTTTEVPVDPDLTLEPPVEDDLPPIPSNKGISVTFILNFYKKMKEGMKTHLRTKIKKNLKKIPRKTHENKIIERME